MTAEKTEIKSFEDAEKAMKARIFIINPIAPLGEQDMKRTWNDCIEMALEILRELKAGVRERIDLLEKYQDDIYRPNSCASIIKELRRLLEGEK